MYGLPRFLPKGKTGDNTLIEDQAHFSRQE